MAEKEKRIRIEQFEYEGFGHCGGFSTDGDGFYCEFSGESIPITKEICEKKCPYDSSISRQEAIERIAKAICAGDCENCSDGPIGGPDCIRWLEDCGKIAKAKAALDALLEKGN